MQDNNARAERPLVMVRAWGDEPMRLLLYRIDNDVCFVGSENAKRPIGLPGDQVFDFDVDRFANLLTAFQQGDQRKLGELWANIPVDDCACNRYQYNVDCSHDQESIADSESTASGHN